MVEFDRSAFIGKFQEEATDLLQRLNEGVIMLEDAPGDRDLIDRMLRDAHTLKGSSRMVGLIEISDIAHRLEDVMVKIREREMPYTPEMSDRFFDALDAIVHLSEIAGTDVAPSIDLPGLQASLTALAEGEDSVGEEASQETAEASPKRSKGPKTTKAQSSPVAASVARDDESDEPDVAEPAVRAVPGQPQRVQRDEKLEAKVQHTIRIKTSQVDDLLNLVSEVVISQIKSEQRARELRQNTAKYAELWQAWLRMRSALTSIPHTEEVVASQLIDEVTIIGSMLTDLRLTQVGFSKSLTDDTSRASVVINDLQEQGMRLRMLPVSTVFSTFPRAMRDLARSFNKDVDLFIEGGDTELDKKVLEEINDPLIHIMRNAVDHGIESAEVRRALGKPETGTIQMSARQEGDHIVIEIADDGAGIDPDKVRASAVRKGYISQAESDAMSDREATYLIFEKGFSTSAIITEISGRGVGMDVVREFIVEKLKGSLDVYSTMGEGSRFRLTIPLTLAIIRALMLRVGDQVYALPTASVDETLRVDPSSVIKVEGREVIRRQRRTIPLVRLADILGVPGDDQAKTKIPIANVGFSGHRMGFIVDALVGEQQIVIKTLGNHLHKVNNIAGVTILGAGEVVPILNVPDLMKNARQRAGRRTTGGEKAETVEGPGKVLICEDSFTTRELERSIFEAAGYEVEVAMDGEEGLEKLRQGLAVDAVVTDVQMPRMTGFELTAAIKADKKLKEIPVIIVTSLEREEEKAQGIAAGADAYITKSVFNQDTLLDTVERLIR